MKTIAYAAPTKWTKDLAKQLKQAGYCVVIDTQAGTIESKLDGAVIFRALEHHNNCWLVRAHKNLFTEVN